METVVVFGSGCFGGEKGVYTDMEQWTRIRLELRHEDTSKREVMAKDRGPLGAAWVSNGPSPPQAQVGSLP